jgi:hypothetical protein
VTPDEDAVDQILSNGYLSGSQYDRIWRRIKSKSTNERKPRGAWFWGSSIALASAAGILFVALARPDLGIVTSKGAQLPGAGVIEISCSSERNGACRGGSTLMFTVDGATAAGFLGAYAQRTDDPTQTRLWYFPDASGRAPAVASGAGMIVVPEGIKIGQEHRPGTYRVNAWIANRPLTRSEVDHAPKGVIIARSMLTIEIVP